MNKSKDTIIQHDCPLPQSEGSEASPVISDKQAAELEDLFKILANDTRLKILGKLTQVDELCVCDLAEAVQMSPQAISNQLQRLADKGIVATKRRCNMVYYRLIDKCVIGLLDKALCLLSDSEI